ncbi:MAG: carbohydrate ABC transporter permease [Clostridiales bacterium]|nr:carbohydrate ABC transporter permease [Clostridiales bacterium]
MARSFLRRLKPKKRVSRSFGGNLAMFLFLLVCGAFTALPIIYSIICAFKPLSELFIYPPRFFVTNPTFDNFRQLFSMQMGLLVPIERYLFNSILVSVVATIVYIVIASLAAYPLAINNFPGKFFLSQLVVFAILFRQEVIQIPQYLVMSKMHMIDTYASLIVPVLIGSFGVFLMRQFMGSIPRSLIESARIDGAGDWRIWRSVVMPMVKPAWLTLLIFTFQSVWNNQGLQYIYSENLKTLPTALSQMSASGISMSGVASAVAVILMLPPVILFIITQSNVIETMSHSGIKD